MNTKAQYQKINLPLIPNKEVYIDSGIANKFVSYMEEIVFLIKMSCDYEVCFLRYIGIVQYRFETNNVSGMLEIFINKKDHIDSIMVHLRNNPDNVEITDVDEQIQALKQLYEYIKIN